MDGNGRWARKKGFPRVAGHREGVKSLKAVLKASAELGVKYLTVYAFSTENWGRPQEEVGFLMTLFSRTIDREVKELMANQVRLRFLGRLQDFSKNLQEKMQKAMAKTKENNRITLNVMVNYGGRAEIIDAVKEITAEGAKKIDEQTLGEHLYTRGMPDPDLLIRTASEMRVSNFMLWQIAYAEIYITPILWPDFKKEELQKAIGAYGQRERRFGKL